MIITITEAGEHLSQLIQRAMAGEEILVGDAGTPLVKLTPVTRHTSRTKPRILGSWTGQVHIRDDFDDPLPEELLDTFYNGPIDPRQKR